MNSSGTFLPFAEHNSTTGQRSWQQFCFHFLMSSCSDHCSARNCSSRSFLCRNRVTAATALALSTSVCSCFFLSAAVRDGRSANTNSLRASRFLSIPPSSNFQPRIMLVSRIGRSNSCSCRGSPAHWSFASRTPTVWTVHLLEDRSGIASRRGFGQERYLVANGQVSHDTMRNSITQMASKIGLCAGTCITDCPYSNLRTSP